MTVKKIILLVIISVTLLLTLSPTITSAYTVQDGIIAGIVWDDVNGNQTQEISEVGIDNVTIYIESQETNEQQTEQTANGGGFAILDLEPGLYSIWCEYEDIISHVSEVEVDELNGINSVNIPLEISVTQAGLNMQHIVYLPLIHNE